MEKARYGKQQSTADLTYPLMGDPLLSVIQKQGDGDKENNKQKLIGDLTPTLLYDYQIFQNLKDMTEKVVNRYSRCWGC